MTYRNECGSSKSITVSGSGRTQNGETLENSTDVTIPTGSGTKDGTIYLSREVLCNTFSISGSGSGNC